MVPETAPLTIAIDGPSGSGKSSVSREVARRLGLAYLDTGAMYRALAWWCTERGIDLADQEAVADASRDLPLEIGTDPDAPLVRLGEVDVAAAIRSTEVSTVVSKVATNLAVRAELRARQQAIIAAAREHTAGIVVEGRDITTVVAPEAERRILLSASAEDRLARRARELHDRDDPGSLEATRDQVLRRDRDDSTVSAFLEPAPGVVGIDTSPLTLTQVVDAVLRVVEDPSAAPASPAASAAPTVPSEESLR